MTRFFIVNLDIKLIRQKDGQTKTETDKQTITKTDRKRKSLTDKDKD